MLIDRIATNNGNQKQKAIYELKSSMRVNVIYGIGSYATDLMRLLDSQGIGIAGACIDEEYLYDGLYFHGMKVLSFKELDTLYENYNIIIGFSDYRTAMKKLKTRTGVASVYFFDAPDSITFFDRSYVIKHSAEFEFTYRLLQDKLSKDTMVAFINSKISGTSNSLFDILVPNQYFSDMISFDDNEAFVDCGAYTGDTILKFTDKVNGKYSRIYAFEPDDANYDMLRKTIDENHMHDVHLIKKGCWSKKGKLSFVSKGGMSSISSEVIDDFIDVDTIDNVVNGEKVSYIKMDIEGAELETLIGAKNTIVKDRPKLAICVYHKPEDLITIPQFIYSIVPEYKFYLRHHQLISWETVLYAVTR